jgi:DNA-binding transcriptional MerR regulator
MYSIGDLAKIAGIPASTLRYYEKEGLFPPISRDSGGRRTYTKTDRDWLDWIVALKQTGMAIEEIKEYVRLMRIGEGTERQRRNILQRHKTKIEFEITQYQVYLEKIIRKIAYYDAVVLSKGTDAFDLK